MLKVIKEDIRFNLRNILVFVLVTQVLLGIEKLLFEYFQYDSLLVEYIFFFVVASIYFVIVVYTVLLFFNYATKPINRDLEHVTSIGNGYLLYRFIGISLFLLLIIINYLIPLIVYTDVSLSDVFDLPVHYYLASLFGLVPIFLLISFYFSKKINNKVFSSAKFIGLVTIQLLIIFVSGYLYFYNNPQLGGGLLVITIIIGIISTHVISNHKTNFKLLKVIEVGLIIAIASLSVYQFTMGISDYKPTDEYYDENYNEEIEFDLTPSDYTVENMNTDYGQLKIYSVEGKEEVNSYRLVSDNYIYTVDGYMADGFNVEFTGIKNYANGTISTGYYDEVYYSSLIDGKAISCYNSLEDEQKNNSCGIEKEVFDVFNLLYGVAEVEERELA